MIHHLIPPPPWFLIVPPGERVWKNERVRPYLISGCRFAGIDGNQAHLCSNGCTCSSSHSAHFIHEHDVKRIAKEIGRNRMTEEERKRLEKGFTLSGLTSDSSRRLFKEIMARRRGPTIERYPWVRERGIHYSIIDIYQYSNLIEYSTTVLFSFYRTHAI